MLITFQVLIVGPSDTLYEGGFFKCHLIFPKEYPLRPPKLRVINEIWHPNIDKNGDVCISILHEPGRSLFCFRFGHFRDFTNLNVTFCHTTRLGVTLTLETALVQEKPETVLE